MAAEPEVNGCLVVLCDMLCVLWLQPAFPPELDGELGPQLIEAWGFLTGVSLGVLAFKPALSVLRVAP